MADAKNPGTAVNLLELVPVRSIGWEKDEKGCVVLLKSKFRHPWFVKHVMPHMKRPYYKVKLDEVGSFLWEVSDGHHKVEEMADMMRTEFGESVEPLFERISLFLRNLERHGFITYKDQTI